MKKLLLSFLLLALILPVIGQNQDEFKFSLVPRRAAQFTLPLSVANGGTGIASYAVGDLLYASGATALSKLAAVAAGQVLTSAGTTTAPAYSPTVTLGATDGTAGGTLTVNPTLGAELIAGLSIANGWTGTGWTDGATRPHTGGTTALTSTWTPTIGVTYQVQITTTSRTVGDLVVRLGGEQVGFISANVTAATYVVTAATAGACIITPTTDYNGTLTVVSIKVLTNGTVTSPIIAPTVLDLTYGKIRFGLQQTSLYFGYQAGYNSAVMYSNGVGYYALNGNTGAFSNGFGNYALNSNTGVYSNGFGHNSLSSNTGAYSNGFGHNALLSNTGAYSNGFGYNALLSNTGVYSNGFGNYALNSNTGAYSNGFGYNSLSSNTGANNSQYGSYATEEVNKIQPAKGTWAAVTSGAADSNVLTSRRYRIAAVINGVETELSATMTGTGTTNLHQYDHTDVPVYVGPKTCTARNIYRQKITDRKYYLVGTIGNNTTTTFTDTQATATYGAVNASPINTFSFGTEAKVLATGDYVLGNSSNPLVNLYLGGVYHETPGNTGLDVTISGMGGNGTDKAGGKVTIASGASTGNAVTPIDFKTSPPGVPGALTENIPVVRMSLDEKGVNTYGGYNVNLTADAVIQMGCVVMADAGTDGRFDILGAGGTTGIGVLRGVGPSAQGTAYDIAIGGIAYVAMAEDKASTRNHFLIMSSTAGFCDDSATVHSDGLNIGVALYSEALYAFTAPGGVTTNTITLNSAPGWAVNDPVIYWQSGDATVPTGLTTGTVYWVRSITTTAITLSATRGGAVLAITANTGSGTTMYFQRLPKAMINLEYSHL